MNKPINLLVGGLTLFAAQGCKAPKQASQQAEHPNIIYVFPDQYRNQAMGFWRQDGFRDKVNFEGDPCILLIWMPLHVNLWSCRLHRVTVR